MKPPVADSVDRVAPNLLFWSVYDPSVKCDLCSTAYRPCSRPSDGWVLIDPIRLDGAAWEEGFGGERPIAIFLSNCNHERAADFYRRQFQIPIYASAGAIRKMKELTVDSISIDHIFPDSAFLHDLRVLSIPGATEGETAFLSSEGFLVFGDAVIHLEREGLALLPKKYCWNDSISRESLKKILDYDFSLVSFAHGTPLRNQAKEHIRQLLD